jgi:hypothetical protein
MNVSTSDEEVRRACLTVRGSEEVRRAGEYLGFSFSPVPLFAFLLISIVISFSPIVVVLTS